MMQYFCSDRKRFFQDDRARQKWGWGAEGNDLMAVICVKKLLIYEICPFFYLYFTQRPNKFIYVRAINYFNRFIFLEI